MNLEGTLHATGRAEAFLHDCAQAYAEKGVRQMYPWQAAALECGCDGGNLVYCAPTSGGKSLVAEVLLLRALLASRNPRACRFRGEQARAQPPAAAPGTVAMCMPCAAHVHVRSLSQAS